MSRFLFPDSGPLGLLTDPRRSAEALAIVYYELKRELLRASKSFGVARLDAFVAATPGRYLALSNDALRLAAGLWAKARRDGQPTADPKALDIDVIIAAQALSYGLTPDDVTVVTTNPRRLSQVIAAKNWTEIPL